MIATQLVLKNSSESAAIGGGLLFFHTPTSNYQAVFKMRKYLKMFLHLRAISRTRVESAENAAFLPVWRLHLTCNFTCLTRAVHCLPEPIKIRNPKILLQMSHPLLLMADDTG